MFLFKKLIQALAVAFPFIWSTQAVRLDNDLLIWEHGMPHQETFEKLKQAIVEASQHDPDPDNQLSDVIHQFFTDMRLAGRMDVSVESMPYPVTGLEWNTWYPFYLRRLEADAKAAHEAALQTHAEAARMEADRRGH